MKGVFLLKMRWRMFIDLLYKNQSGAGGQDGK